ncbi:hypothetical protein FH972_011282 [Carpinus fangiana]|uniref:Uncharacterized protein n=1 Tax=Carpinus fangiana TaxID=176857 RepID=A0A660KSX0_9ROSI|nr:hypothetical protein FH972_011282 [Carpinus fangiana]
MGRMENDGWIGTFPFLGMNQKDDKKEKEQVFCTKSTYPYLLKNGKKKTTKESGRGSQPHNSGCARTEVTLPPPDNHPSISIDAIPKRMRSSNYMDGDTRHILFIEKPTLFTLE